MSPLGPNFANVRRIFCQRKDQVKHIPRNRICRYGSGGHYRELPL